LLAKPSTAQYTVDDLLLKAEECLDSLQVELACKFYERALSIEPDNITVLDSLGALLLETGGSDKAIEISFNSPHTTHM